MSQGTGCRWHAQGWGLQSHTCLRTLPHWQDRQQSWRCGCRVHRRRSAAPKAPVRPGDICLPAEQNSVWLSNRSRNVFNKSPTLVRQSTSTQRQSAWVSVASSNMRPAWQIARFHGCLCSCTCLLSNVTYGRDHTHHTTSWLLFSADYKISNLVVRLQVG